jgi:prepilin-type N-terminal cleavage/methylation domain-containing protein
MNDRSKACTKRSEAERLEAERRQWSAPDLSAARGRASRAALTILHGRSGFTLTELLVVMAIIAVIASLAIPAVMISVNTAYEFRISTQVMQLDGAVDTFRNEKGMYPPDQYYDFDGSWIQWIDPAQNDATLLPILVQRYGPLLQKITPNHREFQPTPGVFSGTEYPIVAWYRQRGQFLNPTNALNFWLGGGLSNSSQYPLSEACRRANELPVTSGGANNAFAARVGNLKPLTFFDFSQTAVDPLGYWVGGNNGPSWDSGAHRGDQFYPQQEVPAFLRSAVQPSTDRPLLYFLDTPMPSPVPNNTLYAPYFVGNSHPLGLKFVPMANEANPMTPIGYGSPGNVRMFASQRFQIIAPGRDNLYGGGGVLRELRDNICNFANSRRLDTMDEAIENMGL